MYRQKEEPSLARIFTIIIVCGLCVWGVVKLASWFREGFIGGQLEATAGDRIARARDLIAQGELDDAYDQLRPIVARLDDEVQTPVARMLMATIAEERGESTLALQHLERATYDYPNSPYQPEAALRYAKALEHTGQAGHLAEAMQVYRELEQSAAPEWRAAALVGLGRERERRDDLLGARDLYRSALKDATWNSNIAADALNALGQVNIALIFGSEATPESKVYVVERGDTLVRIGVKLNTTQSLLMKANKITDPTLLRIGEHLKYTPKDFRIVIERSTGRLFLCDGDGVFKRYFAGLGRSAKPTPLGEYKIEVKVSKPVAHLEDGTLLEPGDPQNPYGSRQMRLTPVREGLPDGIDIRGTNEPDSVGHFASEGNVRMTQDDIEELFDLTTRSTPVSIVEDVDPVEIIGQ